MVHGAAAGDAYTLAAITRLLRRLWAVLWIASTLLAVIVGGKWLVLRSWATRPRQPSLHRAEGVPRQRAPRFRQPGPPIAEDAPPEKPRRPPDPPRQGSAD
jgi:hypothetical protein